ncbi:hypothetical protein AVEN_221751-1 [Araneus ventricosus]|uniref:Uncharacterized protein n=1 Tax=Araneus ventricosus TaxID=182803 RepID=A0A4Y2FQ74_ARAVE|nr:hypothetical protein AVEN_221751-1 [Araneus ventricosus]
MNKKQASLLEQQLATLPVPKKLHHSGICSEFIKCQFAFLQGTTNLPHGILSITCGIKSNVLLPSDHPLPPPCPRSCFFCNVPHCLGGPTCKDFRFCFRNYCCKEGCSKSNRIGD